MNRETASRRHYELAPVWKIVPARATNRIKICWKRVADEQGEEHKIASVHR
jgi:hypothetical protein